jgi:hypothetical protein
MLFSTCSSRDMPINDTFRPSNESLLVQYLMERYAKAGKVPRPIRNASAIMHIEFALALIQILDFDETNQVLTTNVWKRYVRVN